MKYLWLVWVNLRRNVWRTVLTVGSVAMALFLFGALRSVLTTLDDAVEVGSESRLITMSKTAIVFSLPQSYQARLTAVPGVKGVSWANWFGGVYQRPEDFFAQFAIEAETYLPMYPEMKIAPDQLQAFMADRKAAIIGEGLIRKFGWKVGQTVTLRGTIYQGNWDFNIVGTYKPDNPSFGEENMFFHYKYLYEGSDRRASPNWYVLTLTDPSLAPQVSQAVDDQFKSSPSPTKTGTERAFQASFIGMWGNIGFLIRAIGTAVFFAILLVATNTMMMSARERIKEIAVMKTLGFGDGLVFGIVIGEALAITVIGGALGVGLAKLFLDNTPVLQSFFPGFSVKPATMLLGVAISATLGALAGLVPAVQAARLPVVQALRRIA
jgi:putative ABC transport system permease protein